MRLQAVLSLLFLFALLAAIGWLSHLVEHRDEGDAFDRDDLFW